MRDETNKTEIEKKELEKIGKKGIEILVGQAVFNKDQNSQNIILINKNCSAYLLSFLDN